MPSLQRRTDAQLQRMSEHRLRLPNAQWVPQAMTDFDARPERPRVFVHDINCCFTTTSTPSLVLVAFRDEYAKHGVPFGYARDDQVWETTFNTWGARIQVVAIPTGFVGIWTAVV